jgi:hypothetical protein
LLFHAAAHLLEEDSLVRGVLVDEDQPVRVFHQDVEFAEHSQELEGSAAAGCGGALGWWG